MFVTIFERSINRKEVTNVLYTAEGLDRGLRCHKPSRVESPKGKV